MVSTKGEDKKKAKKRTRLHHEEEEEEEEKEEMAEEKRNPSGNNKRRRRKHGVVTDPRFASVHSYPRFQRMPSKESKVPIDGRFVKVLTDKRFAETSAPVVKRGKPKCKKEVNPMLHYYLHEDEKKEEEEEEEEDEESVGLELEPLAEEEEEEEGGEVSSSDEDSDDDQVLLCCCGVDSSATANHIYNTLDGIELLRTSNVLDLRFIHDSLEFNHPPRDITTEKDKGKKGEEESAEVKLLDVDPSDDPWFSALFTFHLFALDPTDPQYKRSAAYARRLTGNNGRGRSRETTCRRRKKNMS